LKLYETGFTRNNKRFSRLGGVNDVDHQNASFPRKEHLDSIARREHLSNQPRQFGLEREIEPPAGLPRIDISQGRRFVEPSDFCLPVLSRAPYPFWLTATFGHVTLVLSINI
jgi:hypothetical protein